MEGPGPMWRFGGRRLDVGARTHVMGILNVTPDSFSDGGRFLDPEDAVRRGIQLADAGADIIDVGGESTRPGSDPVPQGEEARRSVPVVKRLAVEVDVPISIDTRRAAVAEEALGAGAAIVNDVTAGRDPAMFEVVRRAGAGLVLMHMLGEPKTMQESPHYDDVVGEVRAFLAARMAAAIAAGIGAEAVALDLGLGFGKTLQHNLTLMRRIDAFEDLGRPIVVGPSRKSFVGSVTGAEVGDRLPGTAGAVAWLASRGASVVRVHDVAEMVQVVRMVDAIRTAPDG